MSPPDESSSDGIRDTGPDGSGPVAWIRWFRHTDNGTVVFVREMLESAAVVVAIGLILFAVSGVWPPMVAVESGSMQPQMYRGDLIFIMDQHRFPPDAAHGDTGVVTYQEGKDTGYKKFNDYGDVVIYLRYGRSDETPVIHRARFWVDEGENWYDKANKDYILGAENCQELPNCPAPHAGFITKGDNNGEYDQVVRISDPVKPEWIRGTAELKIPWLGHVRLFFSKAAVIGPTVTQQDGTSYSAVPPVQQTHPTADTSRSAATV
ncbi:signal peptidase I [Haladaptatus paucihalophilus DX253]|uniref:Signal peptidase I n=1 Tax=Haladaptatus paucihalophilus DX253 TaxID=797209 RepID=E7QXQ2_HALPU|nr:MULTISPECIES: S26 family signal peptidase [Haladaptatus]EFW90603.1 signal peptidase I [Haladaptatus paucihalophilus DX253]GKZ14869.1 S26 family signal peptidase [Haladaptatus sp. T7]SHL57482.1 signal peptidase, endoplasmic reticulum-type [Haladaptatus paucihalophilus DX253]